MATGQCKRPAADERVLVRKQRPGRYCPPERYRPSTLEKRTTGTAGTDTQCFTEEEEDEILPAFRDSVSNDERSELREQSTSAKERALPELQLS